MFLTKIVSITFPVSSYLNIMLFTHMSPWFNTFTLIFSFSKHLNIKFSKFSFKLKNIFAKLICLRTQVIEINTYRNFLQFFRNCFEFSTPITHNFWQHLEAIFKHLAHYTALSKCVSTKYSKIEIFLHYFWILWRNDIVKKSEQFIGKNYAYIVDEGHWGSM